MITDLYIPVSDTESEKFNYDGELSRDEYDSMVLDNFRRTNRKVDEFMHGYRRSRNSLYYEVDDRQGYNEIYKDKYIKVEALLLDSEKEDLSEEMLFRNLDTHRMFVMLVNINITKFDIVDKSEIPNNSSRYYADDDRNYKGVETERFEYGNAESELRYWLEDCDRVWHDDELNQKMKLLSTPSRDIKITLSDGNTYRLQNCKIFENYSDEKYPIYFAMLVERITEE